MPKSSPKSAQHPIFTGLHRKKCRTWVKEKLVKLASAIGLETVKNMGYSSSKEFIETMAEKLTFSEKILE